MLNSTAKRATLLRGGFRKASLVAPAGALGTSTLRLKVRCYSTPTPTKSKVWDSVEEAIKDVKSGDTLLSGGKYRHHIYECPRSRTY